MRTNKQLFQRLAVSIYRCLPRSISSIVVRMLKATYPIGVVAVVFDESDRLLLLEHRYHKPSWRLPGGLKDKSESPFETAKREVLEEANCVIHPIAVVDAVDVKYTFDVAVAGKLVKQDTFLPNAEIRAYRWADVDEALSLLHPVHSQFVKSALRFLGKFQG